MAAVRGHTTIIELLKATSSDFSINKPDKVRPCQRCPIFALIKQFDSGFDWRMKICIDQIIDGSEPMQNDQTYFVSDIFKKI
jgi:hypothetical protein